MEDRKRAAWTGRSYRSPTTSSVGSAGQEKWWGPLPHAGQEGSGVTGEAYRSSVEGMGELGWLVDLMCCHSVTYQYCSLSASDLPNE